MTVMPGTDRASQTKQTMDNRLTTITISRIARSLVDLLLPRTCVVCGRPLLVDEKNLCIGCLADLPLTYFWNMRHNPMADAFNAQVEATSYIRAVALFYYSGGYEQITQALKYRRNFAAGRWAGAMLGRFMRDGGWRVDAVCCVPLHWTRRRSRGYNQAAVIGRSLASSLGAPFLPRLLIRSRRTRTQTRLDAQERAKNVASAFVADARTCRALQRMHLLLNEGADPLKHPCFDLSVESKFLRTGGSAELSNVLLTGDISSPTVLIVDDVFTTGSTLAACYRALREAFGDSINIAVATLAFVE